MMRAAERTSRRPARREAGSPAGTRYQLVDPTDEPVAIIGLPAAISPARSLAAAESPARSRAAS